MMPQTEPGKLVSRPLFVFKKSLFGVKAGCQHLSFNMFRWSTTGIYNKSKLYEAKDLGLVPPIRFESNTGGNTGK